MTHQPQNDAIPLTEGGCSLFVNKNGNSHSVVGFYSDGTVFSSLSSVIGAGDLDFYRSIAAWIETGARAGTYNIEGSMINFSTCYKGKSDSKVDYSGEIINSETIKFNIKDFRENVEETDVHYNYVGNIKQKKFKLARP